MAVHLPLDIIAKICQELDTPTLLRVDCVAKQWQAVANGPQSGQMWEMNFRTSLAFLGHHHPQPPYYQSKVDAARANSKILTEAEGDDTAFVLKLCCKFALALSNPSLWSVSKPANLFPRTQVARNAPRLPPRLEPPAARVLVLGAKKTGKSHLDLDRADLLIHPQTGQFIQGGGTFGHLNIRRQEYTLQPLGVSFTSNLSDFVPRSEYLPVHDLRRANAVLYCIDVTDGRSLDYVRADLIRKADYHYSLAVKSSAHSIYFSLAVTKCDIPEADWKLTRVEMEDFAAKQQMPITYTSALANQGLATLFVPAIQAALARRYQTLTDVLEDLEEQEAAHRVLEKNGEESDEDEEMPEAEYEARQLAKRNSLRSKLKVPKTAADVRCHLL